jgi:type I restriction enzyme M protein
MLDSDTKRRIDTARDILVGKVPDPKSQVEQITIALIYKFMDDMDAGAEELGGSRTFFTGDFARFGWAKLMRSGLGGHEMLALYAEAITTMPQNPGIPALFRDIFKNAYLPYRDPETLRAFLKIIDEFSYDHSERLGDAFEYLLSVLGSQGDAGQFRTPRHIIDFMVEVLDPKKTETVLDPACGTAGFLISSYKHILRQNRNDKGHSTLTPDEKSRIARNFLGYDISPDMVRLSLVNLYLHGFTDPHVYEYDTLTSEERWNEFADVILANPPFMSPKGGIKPHKRFSIQAKRSEVLFVDYMAEHLTPAGRAGIIVPEGIIFQSQDAYTGLRKMLVEKSLVAVISLPAGCFNPYSGVKTSILILDKSLSKKSDSIAFLKVENDGFGLGAQRRPIEKNDLPQVQSELAAYLQALRSGQPTDEILSLASTAQIISKEKIAANGDYNLSGERYRNGIAANHSFPLISLGDESVFRVDSGGTPKSDIEEYWGGGIYWATLVDLPAGSGFFPVKLLERIGAG